MIDLKTKPLWDHPYLKDNIIAYLGNKRNLLSLLDKALGLCDIDITKAQFVDLFAGSGVVSRYAKLLNFSHIIINDWEHYSYILNKGLVQTNKRDLNHLFKSYEGFEPMLKKINNALLKERYISLYYSPESDDLNRIDYHKERLFYTKSNGEKIDAIRDLIEEYYPAYKELTDQQQQEKSLLVALLIYQCATNTNTSGVFKAYHKRFGGYGNHALSRIFKPIELKEPCLIDSEAKVEVFKSEALDLAKNLKLKKDSVVYLDPPYKEHQYGSNYHLLNTIALWDKPPVSNELKDDGTLKYKAGIRKDWVDTKSDYCYQNKAKEAFKNLIQALNAKYLLVSYSTDGIIPFKDLCTILCEKGSVKMVFNEYTTYRGGRQSVLRSHKNMEFILIVDTHKKSSPQDLFNLLSVMEYKELLLLFKKPIKKDQLCEALEYDKDHNSFLLKLKDQNLKLESIYSFYLNPPLKELETMTDKIIPLKEKIQEYFCYTAQEELEQIDKRLMGSIKDSKERLFFLKEWVKNLKSLAYKKTQDDFHIWILKGSSYQKLYRLEYAKIKKSVDRVREIFRLRLGK